jgi:acetyltransferase-like isoleucine patch superfamily enzyme
VQRWLRESRDRRALERATANDLTPPSPRRYKAYGRNSWVVPPARVTRPELIEIGDDVTILEHAFLSVVEAVPGHMPRLVIGDRTCIGRLAHIACVGEIVIGPDVLTAERIFIGDTYHGYEDVSQPIIAQPMAKPEPVEIQRGAFLGIGAVVLMGVTVGEHAFVGAGAVVSRDVEPRTLVVGNPARAIKRWDPRREEWRPVGGETEPS